MVAAGALKIVFLGTPAFAVPSLTRLIESRHRVVGLVSQPDRPTGRGHRVQPTPTKAVAVAHGVPVLQPERLKDAGFLSALASLGADIGVVAAYGRILPDAVLETPRLGIINVHASILPFYRGAAPVHRAVLAGDAETGVTIMRVVRELDAGPTFAVQRRPIGPDETSADVEAALATLGAGLLLDVVDEIAAGRAVETPQDAARATFAPKITRAESPIDWTRPASAIHDQVRGLHPWPLASTSLGGARLLLLRSRVAGTFPGEVPATPHLEVPATFPGKVPATWDPPGTVLAAHRHGLVVCCGGRTLLQVLEVQPEGRRQMSVGDYLAGHKVVAGTRLGQ